MTSLENAQNKTDKTEETDVRISNNDFLAAIFGDKVSDVKPIIVGFSGNPQKANKGVWQGKPWNIDGSEFASDKNNYFSLAAFRSDGGQYKRQKKYFAHLHAVMLDDIGTKVPMERLALSPSWLVETSAGNYQAGYILQEPISEAAVADKLMKVIIAAGLSDAGAGGPATRLARLPVAINGKNDEVFHCCMKEWNLNLRYSIEDIVNGFELDMSPAERQILHGKCVSSPDAGDEIFVARPDENAVITVLKEKDLYKTPLGDGRHDITCPWVHEHTDSVDDGAAYFEPDDTYPIGGFKCHHGHCAHRKVRNLLDYLDVEIKSARMKPTIRNVAGEIHRISDMAEQELAKSGKHYQRGGLIVTVITDPSTKETQIKDVSQPALTASLCNAALWERYDERSKDWRRIDPPPRVVSVLHDAISYKQLPVLNGLARQPYLREDGTLVMKAGYDSKTGMFSVFDSKKFSIPESPSKLDATDALDMILQLLEEFPFKDEVDRAAALTAILTAAIRPSLPVAPMYHVKAPQISSGKSFLCGIISVFASPRKGSPSSFPKNDEECSKVLLAEFMRGPAVIEFDNLTSDLVPHKTLCTALTSEFITGRILGVSKTATVSTRTLILSSGNNVGPIKDMARRCITINLDPFCENPAARKFKNPNILDDLKKKREKFVSAALTIIRAWVMAGRPQTECDPLASYGQWSDLCRQPILWLGLSDPTKNIFEAMEEDPERETLGRLLEAWYDKYGDSPQMVRKAVEDAVYRGELYEVLDEIAGERDRINRGVLGWWIKRNVGRIVDGKRFVRSAKTMSATAWSVESVF